MRKNISGLFGVIVAAALGGGIVKITEKKKMKKEIELDKKNDALLRLFSEWMSQKQDGKNLKDFFVENEFNKIAIYGVHYLGQCLIKELENSGIEICYVIDKNAANIELESDIEILSPEDDLQEVDAVVVTPFFYFDQIEDELLERLDCPIISIEDVIYEV